MKTVFSGIQSSGNLHLGNYLGSIANWISMQDEYKCIFGIMDLHSITVPQDPKELQKNILDCAIIYLACGLDPKKSIIFQQSTVKEHAELAWILGTLTPLGWLDRMTQFKDKAFNLLSLSSQLVESFENKKQSLFLSGISQYLINPELMKDVNPKVKTEAAASELIRLVLEVMDGNQNKGRTNLGLYSYPVLMAADILLYKADAVPVGEDQKQHLELTRDIAGAFNRRYKSEFFKLPQPLILGNCTRVMSLLDGTKKMSKSDESELSRINLSDDVDSIRKKIKKCKTDSVLGISYDEARPEIYNLLNIFSGVTGRKAEEIAVEYQNFGFGKFKEDLAEAIISKLSPIQNNIKALQSDISYVKKILQDGENKARVAASSNLAEVKKIVGLS